MAENEKVEAAAAEQTEKKTKKSSSKDQKIAQLEKELAEKKDLLLRTAAEFDNYKRRTDAEKLSMTEFIKAQTLKPLLAVFDNVDRANQADVNSPEYNKGVQMIIKQLNEATVNLGLVAIGEVGETFDPTYHEAVMHIEDENLPENSISQVLQKGYKIGDTVIRPAMVQVAN